MNKWNNDIVKEMIETMPGHKKEVLGKALNRNLILTSSRVLSSCTLTIYKEGWLMKLEGTRCNFTVFAKDNDGEFEFIRKPNESKLHKLYEEWTNLNEDDFKNIK